MLSPLLRSHVPGSLMLDARALSSQVLGSHVLDSHVLGARMRSLPPRAGSHRVADTHSAHTCCSHVLGSHMLGTPGPQALGSQVTWLSHAHMLGSREHGTHGPGSRMLRSHLFGATYTCWTLMQALSLGSLVPSSSHVLSSHVLG